MSRRAGRAETGKDRPVLLEKGKVKCYSKEFKGGGGKACSIRNNPIYLKEAESFKVSEF
jgi:hypothetical protein